MQADTLPKLLMEKAAQYGKARAALREKDRGIWQTVTWEQYQENVRRLCLGFVALGLERGDHVCIIGDNRPEWVYTELAVQSAGGISVGLYQDSLGKELAYAINHSDAKFVVVEDQEQVDKILEVREQLPKVERLIYYDPKGMRRYDDPWLLYLPELQELGGRQEQAAYAQLVQAGSGEDIAIICYTSGSTGNPKGAMLRHRNLISMGRNLSDLDKITEADNYVSFLPLAWIGEQMMTFAMALVVGFTVNFPEEPETTREDMREIGPRMMFSPPRIWEEMLTRVQVKMEDSTWFKRWMFGKLLPWGEKMADRRFKHEQPTGKEKFIYGLADFLLFSAIRDHLGLQSTAWAYTGGAALGPDVFRFYHAIGVNLKQIYGQTEIVGIAVLHRDGDIRFHTVGKPIEGEVVIASGGEILLKSGAVFAGYYKNDEASAAALSQNWLHTGDAGYIEEGSGHLVVIDRLKDVIHLANGELFSPQYIENKLKFSPYIKEAVVVGQDRPYTVAMINIDMAATGKWAENRAIAYTTYTDLSQKQPILDLIQAEVEKVNEALPMAARIRRFVILHKELDADDEEMTRTRKLRRGFINEKYARVIEGLYEVSTVRIVVNGKVRYRDGREAYINTELKVMAPANSGAVHVETAAAQLEETAAAAQRGN